MTKKIPFHGTLGFSLYFNGEKVKKKKKGKIQKSCKH